MRIHPIETGKVLVKERQRSGEGRGPVRVVKTMRDPNWTEPLPILAWLIEHDEGLIVVDTGENASAAGPGYFPAWHPYYRTAVRFELEPEDELGPQIERLGFAPADVRRVVLTHLHTDHAGGLRHVTGAEILVDRREIAFASGRMGRLRGYPNQHWPVGLEMTPVDFDERRFGPFTRSRALTEAGDVVLLPTPGHTPGHLSVAARVSDRIVLLAGDATYSQELLLAGAIDGVTQDPATSAKTLALLQELARSEPTVYLPTHDPDAERRLAALEPVPS